MKTESPTAALRMVRLMADQAHKDLTNIAGIKVQPSALELRHSVDRLAGIVKLMDEVILPVFDLPAIPHASEIEKRIVGKLVTDLLAAGYVITVNDGEDDCLVQSTEPAKIFDALSSTDTDKLYLHKDLRHAGWILLVWGNDAHVISNSTTGSDLEAAMAGADALSTKLGG